jgi:hypothetical protein
MTDGKNKVVCPYCLAKQDSDCWKCGGSGLIYLGRPEEEREFEPLPEGDVDIEE